MLIVVARLRFSCSLFATFGAQDSEEKQILEEINHEDRNPYVGGYVDFGRKYLGGRSGK
ncbi:MAG: hypothetical protein LAO76_13585 [Acidobacteriia bacterium]|nr:hypothetical protein [Terriglobia bacterium]